MGSVRHLLRGTCQKLLPLWDPVILVTHCVAPAFLSTKLPARGRKSNLERTRKLAFSADPTALAPKMHADRRNCMAQQPLGAGSDRTVLQFLSAKKNMQAELKKNVPSSP